MQLVVSEEELKNMDTARAVLLSYLPTTMQEETIESFAESIQELFSTTFNVPADVIEVILRFPRLDPTKEDFGVKCLVSFRSRVNKHRVIAQKSKLEAPTIVSTVTEIPEELFEAEDDLLEVEDADEGPRETEEKCKSSEKDKQEVKKEASNASEIPKIVSTVSPNKKNAGSATKSVLAEQKNLKISSEVTSGSAVIISADPSKTSDLKTVQASEEKVEKTANCKAEVSSDVEIQDGDLLGDGKDEKEYNEKDFYESLPISWDGAPEFQWRRCDSQKDYRLIIENVMPEDMYHPWFYPVILRANAVTTSFSYFSSHDFVKDTPGRIELRFLNSNEVVSCCMNHLVHFRASRGRRIKIYLPQLKTVSRYKERMEARLGRVREPTLGMRRLVMKPVKEHITEEQIRNIAFKDFDIEKVEFKNDLLGHRCAVLTFSSAERAISAFCAHNYVQFGDAKGAEGWTKVFFSFVALKDWGKSEPNFLTREEHKQYKTNMAKKGETVKPETEKVSAKRTINSESTVNGSPKRTKLEQNNKASSKRDVLSPKNKSARTEPTRTTSFAGRKFTATHSSRPDNRRQTTHNTVTLRSSASHDHSWRPPSSHLFSQSYMRSSEDTYRNGAPPDSFWRSEPRTPRVWNYAPDSNRIDYSDSSFEERIREQRQQLAMQEEMVRQQQMLQGLSSQLTSGVSSGFGRPPSLVRNGGCGDLFTSGISSQRNWASDAPRLPASQYDGSAWR